MLICLLGILINTWIRPSIRGFVEASTIVRYAWRKSLTTHLESVGFNKEQYKEYIYQNNKSKEELYESWFGDSEYFWIWRKVPFISRKPIPGEELKPKSLELDQSPYASFIGLNEINLTDDRNNSSYEQNPDKILIPSISYESEDISRSQAIENHSNQFPKFFTWVWIIFIVFTFAFPYVTHLPEKNQIDTLLVTYFPELQSSEILKQQVINEWINSKKDFKNKIDCLSSTQKSGLWKFRECLKTNP